MEYPTGAYPTDADAITATAVQNSVVIVYTLYTPGQKFSGFIVAHV